MVEQEKLPVEAVISKKRIRNEVFAKLSEALSTYKNGSPEKKFSQSIKRASKLLAKDFARSEKKSAARAKKAGKPARRKKAKSTQA